MHLGPVEAARATISEEEGDRPTPASGEGSLNSEADRYIAHANDYIRLAEANSSEPNPHELLLAGQISALCAIALAVERLANAVAERSNG